MPTEDVHEESGGQGGELREQLNRIGVDGVVAPRRLREPAAACRRPALVPGVHPG